MGRLYRTVGVHRLPRYAWVGGVIVAAVCVAGASVVASVATLNQPADVHARALRVAPPPPPPADLPPSLQQRLQNMLDAVNEARAEYGRAPVTTHSLVGLAAQRHADEMAATNTMSHIGANGSDAGLRLTAAGFSWSALGENIGAGFEDPHALVRSWMQSTTHRRNLLGDFEFVGVGAAASATNVPYWTMNFANA